MSSCIKATGDVGAVLPNVERLLSTYRELGRPIIHIIRLYSGADVDLVRRGMIAAGASVARPDSPGARIVPMLYPGQADPLDSEWLLSGRLQSIGTSEWVMWKPRWGGFYRTPLSEQLGNLGSTTVVIAGCNFPNCPRATAFGASERDYRTVLVSDGITGLRKHHLHETQNMGIKHATANEIAACVRAAS